MKSAPLKPDRRRFLATAGAGVLAIAGPASTAADDKQEPPKKGPTKFQHACMTLPYSRFPLERALRGIRDAGYQHVAWGTSHREEPGSRKRTPVMPTDAAPQQAKELGKRCRDLGLNPVLMFSTVYPEHPQGLEILTQRIKQANAAGIPRAWRSSPSGSSRRTPRASPRC